MFTDKQLADLNEMESCCGRIEGWITSLEALGLDMTEARQQNEFRKMCVERCREVHAAAQQQGVGSK